MSELSLRDKKRQTTALHIHTAAESLVLKKGLANIKVEEIAAAAQVSRRTFFNYFASKDDAILGLQEPTLTDSARATFEASSDNLLLSTTRLIMTVTATTSIHSKSMKSRVAIRRKYPELVSRFEIYAGKTEQLVRPIVAEKAGADEAEVLIRLAGAILRHAFTADPDLKESSVKKSVAIFLETINRIS